MDQQFGDDYVEGQSSQISLSPEEKYVHILLNQKAYTMYSHVIGICDWNARLENIKVPTIKKTSTGAYVCISKEKIPYFRDHLLEFSCLSPSRLRNADNEIVLGPSLGSCSKCQSSLSADEAVAKHVPVFSLREFCHATVYHGQCSSCRNTEYYDGAEHGLLNMSSFLVAYDLLRSVMHSFVEGKRPLVSWHACWKEDILDIGCTDAANLFTYSKLRFSWQSFLRLIVMDEKYFRCTQCGDGPPPIVVCDGTSVAFQRRMLPPSNDATPLASGCLIGLNYKWKAELWSCIFTVWYHLMENKLGHKNFSSDFILHDQAVR